MTEKSRFYNWIPAPFNPAKTVEHFTHAWETTKKRQTKPSRMREHNQAVLEVTHMLHANP